jgi:hypothetical protein
LQINRDQQGEGRHLPGRPGGRKRVAMPDPEQLPASRLTSFLEYRGDAQSLPKLTQAAQNGRFGQLPAQEFPRLDGRQRPIFAVFI